jgi:hypothetical protein
VPVSPKTFLPSTALVVARSVLHVPVVLSTASAVALLASVDQPAPIVELDGMLFLFLPSFVAYMLTTL